MIDRSETQFQTHALFPCTGEVAGFLDRRIMVHSPELAQDYVPDTWTFYDKAALESVSAFPSAHASAEQPLADPLGETESKRSRRRNHAP